MRLVGIRGLAVVERRSRRKAMSDEKNEKKKLQKKVFLESLGKGTSIIVACKAADVGVVTIWRWRKEKNFNDEVLAIFESRTQVAEDALYKNVLKGNVIAQIFFLKNRASGRWKDKQEATIEGGLEITIRYAGEKDKKKKG